MHAQTGTLLNSGERGEEVKKSSRHDRVAAILTCNVCGIHAPLCPRIHQQEVPILHFPPISGVMQHCSILPTPNDGKVRLCREGHSHTPPLAPGDPQEGGGGVRFHRPSLCTPEACSCDETQTPVHTQSVRDATLASARHGHGFARQRTHTIRP